MTGINWARGIILLLGIFVGVNIYALTTDAIKADTGLYNMLFKITAVMAVALCYFVYCYISAVIDFKAAEWKDDDGSEN